MAGNLYAGSSEAGRRYVDTTDQVTANLAAWYARAGDHQRHLNAALVKELLVPMQLVAVIAEAKDKRVLVKTIALERRDDLANLFIGFEQAIVMVGNLFAHLGDVGIIGRHRDGGTIDCGTGAPAQFAAAKLHLPKERLALFTVLPAVAGDQ